MSNSTEAMRPRADGAGGIDPGRPYTPAELSPLAGLSTRSLYLLCKSKALRHRRKGPNSGRIEILGSWWAEYLAACERGPGRSARPAASRAKASRPKPARPAAPDWQAELDAERRA